MRDPPESKLLENEEREREVLRSTVPAPANHGCQQKMEGSQEVVLFLSVAGFESLDTFNGFQLAQAEEANYKTLREKSEEHFSLCKN